MLPYNTANVFFPNKNQFCHSRIVPFLFSLLFSLLSIYKNVPDLAVGDIFLFLIHGAVCSACTVILAFLIHAEGIEGSGTEDVLLRYVMHRYGDAEH